ncbi:MAG: 5-(carboxyamino)imidazole ribonucleotide synthase [Agarilytica sp.]
MSKHIAIIGSGQLARMMALDGIPMGQRFSFVAEEKEDAVCVDGLGKIVRRTENMDVAALYEALGKPDVITVEKEHVDIPLLTALGKHCPVHPNPNALEKFKNRRVEKRFLQSLDIPIAPFNEVRNEEDFHSAVRSLEKPIFLKTEEEGYDGYNQFKITDENQAQVVGELDFPGHWVAEQGIPFEREISFIAVRSWKGEIVFYPGSENYHNQGTLLTSLSPAPKLPDNISARARDYLTRMLEALDYVGVMCMECFLWGDQLLVNEIAPRVHNSGHWTSKGAMTSQFENHVRAVAELPLGSTETHGVSAMLNLLGVTVDAAEVSDATTFLTMYGKSVRPRRKLGHITAISNDYDKAKEKLKVLEKIAYDK